jgi:uncharacterized tellurite resistance protein B-like protein
MSSGDSFHERGMALENQFFAKVDQKLLEKIRSQQAAQANAEGLEKALGFSLSPELAQSLVTMGITSQSFQALRLVPLVAVAWADGTVSEDERYEICQVAKRQGVLDSEAACELLEAWMGQPPGPELLKSWSNYVSAILGQLNDSQKSELRSGLVDEMNRVAHATGGLLGWGSVSPSENQVIQTIKRALS